ncbi:major vault protein-like isoform X2 [Ptychodera flava]|uniref:major vault protein-like isoform X2 n=1 Tax=Ptychodera flava TaxID=63121 RepID=UPI003969D288
MSNIVGIGPNKFVHVLNLTTNVTGLAVGPQTLVLQTNEKLVAGPTPCVVVPPGYYCIVKDPISNYEAGKPCQLKHGHFEVRFHKEPFPLYPGESLVDASDFLMKPSPTSKDYSAAVKKLPIVKANHAIKLTARVDHDDNGITRKAGDIWQLEGPLTYMPTAEAEILEIVQPMVISDGQALRIRAVIGFTDRNDVERISGQEWLVKKQGAYLKEVYEEVVEEQTAFTLTEEKALHLKATETIVDALGDKRLAGSEWLLTCEQIESYITDIGVEVVNTVNKTVLGKNEFCVVYDPLDDKGHCRLGQRELRKGVSSFFLQPGESIPNGIQKAFILQEDEAVVVQSTIAFTDEEAKKKREPGDRWLIRGPHNYIPPIEVEVLKEPNGQLVRKAIPLAENEGIYVRNLHTGDVRAIMGPQSYLLQEYEVLWQKELSPLMEILLRKGGGHGGEDIRKMAYFESSIEPAYVGNKPRDKTRVVTYRCPGNTAVQVYNYKKKTARVIFGPDMVILGPDENFNILSLTGKPKRDNALQTICLMLGPDYITDIIEVETSDHARLRVKIAFNNHFEFKHGDPKEEQKIFSVSDFIGFACKQVGSRIRGAVAHTPFDTFHRCSAQIIRQAVFGIDEDGTPRKKLHFPSNGLCITSIDIQSIEPVDANMRDSLMKSVQMAIEIATNSVEASASHEARRIEQEARGKLDRQKLLNEQKSERARTELYELKAVTAAVESTGQAKAEAQAQAEKLIIEGQSEIEAAQLKAQAEEIEDTADLETQEELRKAELAFTKDRNTLEINRAKHLAEIEVTKFSDMVSALGIQTIAAVATSGPQHQVDLLKGLGIETTLITSGDNPINLFNYANGLVGNKET